MKKLHVAIIGLGKISSIYLENLSTTFNDRVQLVGVVDLIASRAGEVAQKYQLKSYADVEELLSDKDVDLVLNLTTPQSHFELSKRALEAGKSVYVEKPLSLTVEQASELVVLAKKNNVLLGSAPDTFLGAGIQTCKKLIEDGWIGRPVAATACMMNHGHESWHPDPEFYYKSGGGPLFDMGPYYITALVHLLGPVDSVSAYAKKSFETRIISSEPRKGEVISVDVDTHIAGLLHFENGCVATLVTSFDVHHHTLPNIEIYGTSGTLRVPDPNTFGGPVLFCPHTEKQFYEIPLLFGFAENSRGYGVADMAQAINENRPVRPSGALALHVVTVMNRLLEASEQKKQLEI